MRIENKPFDRNAGLSGAEASASQPSGGDNGRSWHVSAGKDSVSLSAMTDLIALASRVGDAGRSEHVARIAAQYRSGSYAINNEALGQALIDRAFED
jgi:anti-sigma28 factor (negative regulator of flagellin synthesis)